jgi:adenylate cyclase
MFADIRGFSRISAKLQSAAALVEWLSDVMSVLSDCVVAEEGVLVDYIGDELMAMWGAPARQEDHAIRACRAAQLMMAEVRRMSAEWHAKLGETFDVGIGINSGPAYVGNTGSRRKFKYGPLGTTVNMASRVQGTTKYLGSPILITAETLRGAGENLTTRRLRKVQVVNINTPVELYELAMNPDEKWQTLRRQYELALDSFEKGNLAQSVGILGTLLETYPDDVASRMLLRHASDAFATGKAPEAVWEMPMK